MAYRVLSGRSTASSASSAFSSFSTSTRSGLRSKRQLPSDIRVRPIWGKQRGHAKGGSRHDFENSSSQSPFARHLETLQRHYFPRSSSTAPKNPTSIPSNSPLRGLTPEQGGHKQIQPQHEALLKAANQSHHASQLMDRAQATEEHTLAPVLDSADAAVTGQKNHLHKVLWKHLKTRRWMAWEKAFETFKAAQLPPDEVSYTLLLHGLLISRNHSSIEAKAVLEEMKESKVHPALIRFNEVLLDFYYSMEGYDIVLTDIQWRSVLRSAWLIAALVKGRRERYIAKLSQSLKHQGIPEENLPNIHDLGALWYTGVDPLLPAIVQQQLLEDSKDEMDQIENIYTVSNSVISNVFQPNKIS